MLACAGCRPAGPGPGGGGLPPPPEERPEAPKGKAIADPVLREARDEAEVILGGLLAGKFENDPDMWPVARKLKGYQSWSVKDQEIVRDGAAEFRGTLSGPRGRARFGMTLVKQTNGRWAVGQFTGPDRD
jgi:hypothetical protein